MMNIGDIYKEDIFSSEFYIVRPSKNSGLQFFKYPSCEYCQIDPNKNYTKVRSVLESPTIVHTEYTTHKI